MTIGIGGAVLALLLGATTTGIFAGPLTELYSRGGQTRLNYDEKRIAVSGGGILLFGLLVNVALMAIVGLAHRVLEPALSLDFAQGFLPGRRGSIILLLAALATGFVGTLDDAFGSQRVKGLRGHIGALVKEGRVTTGFLKLAVGSTLGLFIGWQVGHGPAEILLDIATVGALMNLFNLLDLRPGRALKAFLFLAAFLLMLPLVDSHGFLSMLAGAAAVLLVLDLHERVMLGDAGANLLGGVLGAVLVLDLQVGARGVLALFAIILNLLSESISLSKVISAVPLFRILDDLGRRMPEESS